MVTFERVRELLDYNSDTGYMFWKYDRTNQIKAMSKAGHLRKDGYVQITIDCIKYRIHRIVWLWVHGYLPENSIDHINGIPNDNRLINLREVSHCCNMRNMKMKLNNKSGVIGVAYHKLNKNWAASICVNGKGLYLGSRDNLYDAALLRLNAEIEYKYYECRNESSAYQYISRIDSNL